MKTCFLVATSFLVSILAFSGEVFSQQSSQESTLVLISPTSGLPGQEISLPIYLTAATGVEVGSITLELVFPNPLVSFVTVQRSLVSEMVGAQITSEVRVSSEDESKSELQVALFTPETGSQMAIPDGLLGFITFQLSEEAQLEAIIVLSIRGSARTTGPLPKPVEPLTIHGGEISLGEIIFACFFYMH